MATSGGKTITLADLGVSPATSTPAAPTPAPAPAPTGFLGKVEGGLSSLLHKAEGLVGIKPSTPSAAPAAAPTKQISLADLGVSSGPKGSPAPSSAPKTSFSLADLGVDTGTSSPASSSAPVSAALPPATPPTNIPVPAPKTGLDALFPSTSDIASDTGATDTSTPQTTPTGTLDFIKSTARAFPRDAAAVGAAVGQAGINIFNPSAGARAADIGASIPTNGSWWSKLLFGPEPIKGLPQTAADYEMAINNSSFAKAHGLTKYAMPLGVLGSTAPVGLDFLGVGGEKGAIDALVAANDVESAAKVLRQIGVHEDLVLPAAEHIAATGDRVAVENELKSVEALQKSTTAIPASSAGAEDFATDGAKAVIRGEGDVAAAPIKSAEEAAPRAADEATEASRTATAAADTAKPAVRSIDDIERDLEDMKQQESFLKDVVADHPGKALAKFRSPTTGELPEVRGTRTFSGDKIAGTRGAFATRGDSIIQDLLGQDETNGGDITVAQKKLDDYTALRAQYAQTQDTVRALTQELRSARTSAAEEASAARRGASATTERAKAAAQSVREPMTRAERKEGTIADIIQRKAEVVRKGAQAPTKGIVEGNASITSQRNAALETEYGGIESGPFKGWSEAMRNWFQDWIFARQSVDVETKVALRKFEILKRVPGETEEQATRRLFDWLSEFYGRKRKDGVQGQVEKLLDRWLTEEQNAGIKVADKNDYIPIYLKDAAEESEGELPADRRVGLKPGFAMQSVFKDYFEAAQAGYAPKYDNMYDILQARARAHYKAMADAEFFRNGARNGWIVPANAVDEDLKSQFRHLDSERFPAQQAMYGNTIYRGVFAAPEGVAKKVNAYLNNPDTTLQKIANVAGSLKGTALSVGIPRLSAIPGIKQIADHSPELVKDLLETGSGFVVHFWNVLPREAAADIAISPIRAPFEIAKYFYYGLNPRAAARFVDKNLESARILVRNGMKLATEDQAFHALATPETKIGKVGAAGKATSDYLHHLFGENYFQRILPARKIANGKKLMDWYVKKGFSEKDAARQAASDMNTIYGGINWESLGRSRNWQEFMRATILAPDYLETNVKQGTNIVKAFLKPKSVAGRIWRGMMGAYAGSYLVANIINHENSGHWMYQNDLLHQFSIDMGKDPDNGKTRYLNIYGTGVEFLRLPTYVISAIAKGDLADLNSILLNRMSVPVGSVGAFLFNVDWKGDPIFGPDKYSRPQSGSQEASNVFDNTIGRIFPGSLTDAKSIAKGTLSSNVGIPKALGLPITEKDTSATPAEINKLKAQAASDVKKGDYRLLNKLVKAGVISPRSKAQFIRTARSGPTVRQVKSKEKTKAKAKQARVNVSEMGL